MTNTKETDAEYLAEIEAVEADLKHEGGLRRNSRWVIQYFKEQENEEAWPAVWDDLLRDVAIWIVESRRMGMT